MRKWWRFSPLILLLVVVGFLFAQLNQKEAVLPSEDWRGKPLPEFSLPNLLDEKQRLTKQSLPQQPFILNVWASWCMWCIKEFPVLLALQAQGVPIVGLTYTDYPDDARRALEKWGNPFSLILDDFEHSFLIKTLNINAAPTSYLVDKNGVIRYQQKGYNPDFAQDFLPRLEALRKESE